MKVLLFILLFLSLQLLSQETKPLLFVGIYETATEGFCGKDVLIKDEMVGYSEYAIKRKQFLETHIKNSRTLLVENNEAIIIYQYDKKIPGWNCASKVISYKRGKTVQDCQKMLSDNLEKNPSDFATKPEIILTWHGKSL